MIKYCSNCGNELSENINYCPYCGEKIIRELKETKTINETKEESFDPNEFENPNSLAIAGFVTAIISLLLNFWGIVGIVATVLSAVAINQVNKSKERGKGLAIAGVIIGTFSILYGLFQIINSINYFSLMF